MKLQVMSDLHVINMGHRYGPNYWHTEFLPSIQTDADVLVLAGDIVSLAPRNWRWSMERLKDLRKMYAHVVMVAGNHEFYGTSITDVDLNEVEADTGVNVLFPGKTVVINGQRFLGGTMFQPEPPEDHIARFNEISDHFCIHDFNESAPAEYKALKSYLLKELREGDVLVTHHAPSLFSLDPQWAGHPCNYWFITEDMEPVILEKKPALALHGHIHSPMDYQLGSTRVIASPYGYPGEGVTFDPHLVVEI